MRKFFISKMTDLSGIHTVHQNGCKEMIDGKIELGYYFSCHAAIIQALKIVKKVNGCPQCISECHIQNKENAFEDMVM